MVCQSFPYSPVSVLVLMNECKYTYFRATSGPPNSRFSIVLTRSVTNSPTLAISFELSHYSLPCNFQRQIQPEISKQKIPQDRYIKESNLQNTQIKN